MSASRAGSSTPSASSGWCAATSCATWCPSASRCWWSPPSSTASEGDLDRLAAYAGAGGHLVLGWRTGYADAEGRVRAQRAPARLGEAAGTWFEETSLRWWSRCRLTGRLAGAGTTFAEGLELDGAEAGDLHVPAPGPVGRRDHPTGRRRADHRRRHGARPGAGRGVVRWLAPFPVSGWRRTHSVTVSSSSTGTGRLHVVHNWGWSRLPRRPTPRSPTSSPAMPTGRARRPGSWTSGWSAAGPGDRLTRRCNPARHRSFSLAHGVWRWRGASMLVRWRVRVRDRNDAKGPAPMTALSSAALPTLSASVPTYDRQAACVGIVHFGFGNFHRSHVAMYLDRLMETGEGLDWGICGVGVLEQDAAMRDVMRAQDCLFTLVVRAPGRLARAARRRLGAGVPLRTRRRRGRAPAARRPRRADRQPHRHRGRLPEEPRHR